MKYKTFFKANRLFPLLLLLFLVSFFLRFYKIPDNLFFGPEQGIDFLAIKDIALNHNPTLIGPKTDVSGVFHGPLYYYLGVIPFLLSSGSPVFIAGFFILLHSLSVFLIYLIGKEFFNKTVGVISAIIFTVSFGTIVYAHWLSNTPPVLYLSGLFFLFFYRFLNGKIYNLWIAAFFWGLTIQSVFLNFVFYSFVLIVSILLFRKYIFSQKKTDLLIFLLIAFLSSSLTYVLFDLKNNFLLGKSLLQLINQQSGFHMALIPSILQTFSYFLSQLSSFILPFLSLPSVAVLILGCYFLKKAYAKHKNGVLLLIIWLFTPLFLLLFLKHATLDQFFATIALPSIILCSLVIYYTSKKYKTVSFCLFFGIVAWHVFIFVTNIPDNNHMFFQAPQPKLKLADQRVVIDTIYDLSNNDPFSVQAYTIPSWMQQGWEYLFWYYGTTNHEGKLPQETAAKKLFVIIQNPGNEKSQIDFQNQWLTNTVSTWGEKQTEFSSGILTVQMLKVQ